MTFRDFMDASYALLAEEHTRITPFASLLDVAERIAPQQPKPSPARKQDTTARNEESMSILTAAMSGTKGKGPLMGARRKPRV